MSFRVGAGPQPDLFTIYADDGSVLGTVELACAGVPVVGGFLPVMFRGVTRVGRDEPDDLSTSARPA